ncbi:MAG: DUF4349 domain-containing protein [Fimbriimonadaceae bacterium]|nr:DUF4349 domain-containing protein [Fimbriimonadaceae bacterium]
MRRFSQGFFVIVFGVGLGLSGHADSPRSAAEIRNGGVVIKVAAYSDARTKLAQMVGKAGGEFESVKTISHENGRLSGRFLVSVPKAQLDGLTDEVRTLGTLFSETASKLNAALELEGLERTALRLGKHRQWLEGLSKRNGLRARDALYIRDRIAATESEIDTVRLEQSRLRSGLGKAKVHITLFEPYSRTEMETPGGTSWQDRMRTQVMNAGKQFAWNALGFLLSAVQFLLVALPVWLLGRFLWGRFGARAWQSFRGMGGSGGTGGSGDS